MDDHDDEYEGGVDEDEAEALREFETLLAEAPDVDQEVEAMYQAIEQSDNTEQRAAKRRKRGKKNVDEVAALEGEVEEDLDNVVAGTDRPFFGRQRTALYGPQVDEIYGEGDQARIAPDEDEHEEEVGPRKRRRPRRTERTKLQPHIDRLSGEANMAYVSKDYNMAIKLFTEVVRLDPKNPGPLNTLGMIHEEQGNLQKATRFYYIAAHYQLKDAALWKRVASMSSQLDGGAETAIYCYSRAIRLEPNDLDSVWDRSYLYYELGKYQKAANGFANLLQQRPGDPHTIRMLAKVYQAMGKTPLAVSLVEEQFGQLHRENNNMLKLVNTLADLYLQQKRYQNALALIDEATANLDTEAVPLEVLAKKGVCLCHLGRVQDAEIAFDRLWEQDVEASTDLYHEMADAYFDAKEYERALEAYQLLIRAPVTSSDSVTVYPYDNPTTWNRMGVCYQTLGDANEAIEYFQKVLQRTPDQAEVRLALSDLYSKQGRVPDALRLMSGVTHSLTTHAAEEDEEEVEFKPNPNPPKGTRREVRGTVRNQMVLDLKMAFQKAKLLYQEGQYAQFLEVALPYVATNLRHEPNVKRSIGGGGDGDNDDDGQLPRSVSDLLAVIEPHFNGKLLRFLPRDGLSGEGVAQKGSLQAFSLHLGQELEPDEYILLALGTVRALQHEREIAKAYAVVRLLLASSTLPPEAVVDARRLALDLSMDMGDDDAILTHARGLCSLIPDDVSVWRIFLAVTDRTNRWTSSQKFLTRQLTKHPNSAPVLSVAGHFASSIGDHTLASVRYIRGYKLRTDNLALILCIAVSYLRRTTQRKTLDRHSCVEHAMSFLSEYARRRGEQTSEAQYNTGRGFHQLGLVHLAVPHYEKCLANLTDFTYKREAAVAMSQIHKENGNFVAARDLLIAHCTI